MNFFAANEKIMALCGRHNIHVYPLSSQPAGEMLPLDLTSNLPEDSKATPEKLSAVCCDVSYDGNFVVAADSGKNVFVFENNSNSWELFSSWEMEKRIVKVQFDKKNSFVIMTDKTGDIYFSYMNLKTVTAPRKAMGHTSFILDVILTEDNTRIITCDRDEKIRISKFPSSHEIIDYKLGHKESVINIALVNRDVHLLSVSAEGTLKLWHMSESKAVGTWNVFQTLKLERIHEAEITRMKATDVAGKVYVSVIISGFKELPVFEINLLEKSIRQFGQSKMVTDFTDMIWVKEHLYVFSPEVASIKQYLVGDTGLVCVGDFEIPAVQSAKDDWKLFAEYNKPFFPLKKRVPSEILATVSNAKKLVLAQFGPLSEEEPNPMTQKVLKLEHTADDEADFHEKLVKMSKDVTPAAVANRSPVTVFRGLAAAHHRPLAAHHPTHAVEERPAHGRYEHGHSLLEKPAAPGPSNKYNMQERDIASVHELMKTGDRIFKTDSKEIDPLDEKLIAMEEGRSVEMISGATQTESKYVIAVETETVTKSPDSEGSLSKK